MRTSSVNIDLRAITVSEFEKFNEKYIKGEYDPLYNRFIKFFMFNAWDVKQYSDEKKITLEEGIIRYIREHQPEELLTPKNRDSTKQMSIGQSYRNTNYTVKEVIFYYNQHMESFEGFLREMAGEEK